MSGITYDYMEEYIRNLIPEGTDKFKELEDFAKEIRFLLHKKKLQNF